MATTNRGAELREMREAAGLTQEMMATRLGVAENTVARWERDELPVLGRTILAARQALASAPARVNPWTRFDLFWTNSCVQTTTGGLEIADPVSTGVAFRGTWSQVVTELGRVSDRNATNDWRYVIIGPHGERYRSDFGERVQCD